MRHECARSPAEAFWAFDPYALVYPGDPWHCDLDAVFKNERQHYRFTAELKRRLTPLDPRFVQVGVVGHKGSGKTTQVRQVIAGLADKGLEAVFIDALSYFDQGDLSFADVVLVLVSRVLALLEEAKATLPQRHYEDVRRWFAEEMFTETQRRQLVGGLETEAAAGGGISFLAKLTGKVTAAFKTDNDYRREIRQRADRDPRTLLDNANHFLDAAHEALAERHKAPRQLIVVFDNLEKLADRAQVDSAVLRRADDLRHLRCHLALFFDPADQYAPATVQAGQAFDVVTVPMLPVRERDDRPEHVSAAVSAAVRDLLARRADLGRVFADIDGCVHEVARLSGGRLRDVFNLARLACEEADPDPVTTEHVAAAARRLRGERVVLARAEHWLRLAQIARDQQVVNAPDDGHLLLHSLVLNYDGDPWWDVHPLVRLDARFEEAWRAQSATVSA